MQHAGCTGNICWVWTCRPTEKGLSRRRVAAFVVYTVYSWLYRVALYLGIAVFVYYKFTKTLGILLFSVEIWWFVFGPVFREIGALSGLRSRMRMNPVLGGLLLGVLGGMIWIGLPLERSITTPAVTVPEAQQVVYAPAAGVIEGIHVGKGDMVRAGMPVVDLASRELEAELTILEERLAILKIERGQSEDPGVGPRALAAEAGGDRGGVRRA